MPFAGSLVNLEIRRVCLAELKRDAPAHHTDAINRVDKGLGIREQYVTVRQFCHRTVSLVVPLWRHDDLRPMARFSENARDLLRNRLIDYADSID
jgi:hypothetical protein